MMTLFSRYGFFLFLLAITNGYVGNIACMYGPKVVKEEHQEHASSILIAVLVIGIGIGSVLNNPVVKAL